MIASSEAQGIKIVSLWWLTILSYHFPSEEEPKIIPYICMEIYTKNFSLHHPCLFWCTPSIYGWIEWYSDEQFPQCDTINKWQLLVSTSSGLILARKNFQEKCKCVVLPKRKKKRYWKEATSLSGKKGLWVGAAGAARNFSGHQNSQVHRTSLKSPNQGSSFPFSSSLGPSATTGRFFSLSHKPMSGVSPRL